MIAWKRGTVALLGFVLLSSILESHPASAKPKKDKERGQTEQVQPGTTTTPSPGGWMGPGTTTTSPGGWMGTGTQSTTRLITFSSSQRTTLISILQGTSTRSELIDRATRLQINSQLSSLPPGIRKQLLRGKGLPPGIAKKVVLPRTVCSYLNLPAQYDVLVVGQNVVLYNSVTRVISDVLINVL